MLIGGVGALLACYAFAKFKMPDIIDDMKGIVTGPVFGALDTAADALLPNQPVQLRREAQELAERRERLRRALQVECSLTYENYEREKCVQAQLDWDAYINDRTEFQNQIVQLTTEGGELYNEFGFWWYFIFGRESKGSSVGSIKYLTPFLGEPRLIVGPYVYWGNFPLFEINVADLPTKGELDKRWSPMRMNHRAQCPLALSQAFFDAMESQKSITDYYGHP